MTCDGIPCLECELACPRDDCPYNGISKEQFAASNRMDKDITEIEPEKKRKTREYNRRYRIEHKTEISKYNREYRKAHQEYFKEHQWDRVRKKILRSYGRAV